MDDRSLKVLEFFRLLDILKEFSISSLGRKRCEALRPLRDVSLIQLRLTEVLELRDILKHFGEIPLRGLKDIEEVLRRLDVEGSVLSIQELIDIYWQIELCKGLRRFFHKLEPLKAPHLLDKVSQLSSLKALEKEILQAINTKGEILDRASPALSEIRGRIGTVREKAKAILAHLLHRHELQPIFQEDLITLRNGRYVLLIKSDSKHQLEGIIHDHSQSQQTLFFEPLQVVPFNNEINMLMGEEREEEYRILAELSNKVREEKENLGRDIETLGEMDLLYGMAKFSLLLEGSQPLLNGEGKVEMRKARNPLLTLQKTKEVVPIDLRLGKGIKVIILSGANAGGKTVALKTLGLLTVMAQCGIPIPVAEGSQVTVFQDIFALIGDEQSIETNLSTFSSHLLHVNHILEKSGPHSLVLLDELGVGTHASEGCALAMGFLDRFREKGASVAVTTHFDRLKVYGYLHPDVENVAVEFDEETLEPRYTLSYGSSGLSNAFLVAEKLRISEEVLARASHHRDGSEQEVTRSLNALEGLKSDAEKERQAFLQAKKEIEQERQKLETLLKNIKGKRQEIFLKAEGKAGEAVQKVEKELREWIHRLKMDRSISSPPHLSLRRKEIQEVKEKYFPSIKRKENSLSGGFKVGERVKIRSLQSQGILMSVEEPLNQAEVVTPRVKVRTSLSDIVRVTEREEEKEEGASKEKFLPPKEVSAPPAQLNVIGLTVEDALPKVDKFIDQALLHGLENVRIIHGVGSGRLRSAIGQYLNEHQAVKQVRPGEAKEGGTGITLVELI
jgi:DNA mismatch repair protein MutS2